MLQSSLNFYSVIALRQCNVYLDITERHPLEKVDENTFEATETGIKTLEIIATFPSNERISYTTLIDVRDDS